MFSTEILDWSICPSPSVSSRCWMKKKEGNENMSFQIFLVLLSVHALPIGILIEYLVASISLQHYRLFTTDYHPYRSIAVSLALVGLHHIEYLIQRKLNLIWVGYSTWTQHISNSLDRSSSSRIRHGIWGESLYYQIWPGREAFFFTYPGIRVMVRSFLLALSVFIQRKQVGDQKNYRYGTFVTRDRNRLRS